MITLELSGFQGFKRITCKNIEEARKQFVEAKKETYEAYSMGEHVACRWTYFELIENGSIIKSGKI